jgi:hypothetical protein
VGVAACSLSLVDGAFVDLVAIGAPSTRRTLVWKPHAVHAESVLATPRRRGPPKADGLGCSLSPCAQYHFPFSY